MEAQNQDSASFLEALAGVSVEALRSAPGEIQGGLARYGRWLTAPLLLATIALGAMFLAGNVKSDPARGLLIVFAALSILWFMLRFLIRGIILIVPGHFLYHNFDSAKFFIELVVKVLAGILVLVVTVWKFPGEHLLLGAVILVGLLSLCLSLIDSASLRTLKSTTNLLIFVMIGYLAYQSDYLPNSVRHALDNTFGGWSRQLPNQLPRISIGDVAVGTAVRVNQKGEVIVFYAEYSASPCGLDFYSKEIPHPITGKMTKPATEAIYNSVAKCYREQLPKPSSVRPVEKRPNASLPSNGTTGRVKQHNGLPAISDGGLREIARSLSFSNSQFSLNQPYRGLYVIAKGNDLDRRWVEHSISAYYNADRNTARLAIAPVFSSDLSDEASDLVLSNNNGALQRSGVFAGPAELLVLEITLHCAPDTVYDRFQLCRIDGDAFLHTKEGARVESEIVLAVIGVTQQEAVQDALRDLAVSIDL